MHLGFRLILYLFNSLIPTVQNEQYSYDDAFSCDSIICIVFELKAKYAIPRISDVFIINDFGTERVRIQNGFPFLHLDISFSSFNSIYI